MGKQAMFTYNKNYTDLRSVRMKLTFNFMRIQDEPIIFRIYIFKSRDDVPPNPFCLFNGRGEIISSGQ